jgi:hypothetical protein
MRVISLFVLLGFTLVSPAAALGQAQVAPPFSKLFRPSTPLLRPGAGVSPPDGNTANLPVQPPLSPRVVCGMTMIPLDPSFDANIRRPVPPSGEKFTIKALKPPVCGQ